ncbi:MAG: N4-gp56 family major capsid protein [Erysipelotrichaceae bacterium]
MTQTKLENLFNPQVVSNMVSASLPSKLKFLELSRYDNTLEGVAGNTITLPQYKYIGAAEDVAEGVEVVPVVLTSTSQSHTVKKAVRAITLTDESVLSGDGSPITQSIEQIEQSISDRINQDSVTALLTATKEFDAQAPISYNVICDAIDLFAEEDDEAKVLFLHTSQKSTIRNSSEYMVGVEDAFVKSAVAEVAGCQVVYSNDVPHDKVAGTYTNFIVKEGALAMYLKRKLQIAEQRNELAGSTHYVANQHYVVALENDSKVVKIKTTKA